MELIGPSLTLRPVTPDDVPALFTLGSDPEVTQWFSWGPYTSEAQPAAYVADQEAKRERGEQLDLIMVHREHGPVGITGISEWSHRDLRGVVGTWFARRWWGSGLNQESKALVAHLAFELCGLQRLSAYADVRNVRSRRALEKAGFVHEGVLRAWHRHGDTQKDVAMLSLLPSEWPHTPLAVIPVEVRGRVPEAFRP